MNIHHSPEILVIGYGNPLRADDGVGQRVALAVAGWGRPGVSSLAVHQLTPELADPLAAARLALFVDARLAVEGESARVRPLEPASPRATLGHASDPRSLLALARAVYGRCPRAWLITVPATDLSLGECLSPSASRGMEDALMEIGILVGREAKDEPCTRSA